MYLLCLFSVFSLQMKSMEQFLGELHQRVAQVPHEQGGELGSVLASINQQLSAITEHIQNGGAALGSPARPIPLSLYENDPAALYKQGRLFEALEVVLESKDMKAVSRLLALSSPGELRDVHDRLSRSGEWGDDEALVLLCLAQQLLVDMLTNPSYKQASGRAAMTRQVEWLKAVIMMIVKALKSVSAGSAQHCMTILTSIGLDIKELQKAFGADGSSSSMQSDIHMLSYIVDSFRR
jgi:hypothetical protein